MAVEPIQSRIQPSGMFFDPTVLVQLACPACKVDLLLEGTHLICAGCGRAYPVADGIPVLIVERAKRADAGS